MKMNALIKSSAKLVLAATLVVTPALAGPGAGVKSAPSGELRSEVSVKGSAELLRFANENAGSIAAKVSQADVSVDVAKAITNAKNVFELAVIPGIGSAFSSVLKEKSTALATTKATAQIVSALTATDHVLNESYRMSKGMGTFVRDHLLADLAEKIATGQIRRSNASAIVKLIADASVKLQRGKSADEIESIIGAGSCNLPMERREALTQIISEAADIYDANSATLSAGESVCVGFGTVLGATGQDATSRIERLSDKDLCNVLNRGVVGTPNCQANAVNEMLKARGVKVADSAGVSLTN